jgi:hypothetical protein
MCFGDGIVDAVTTIHHSATTAHAALELQDHLLCTSTELDRLQRLLADAAQTLLQHFTGADALLRGVPDDTARGAHELIAQAVQSLQFEDMATQLIGHTRSRIGHVADRLAALALADDTDEGAAQAAPELPNPVVQDEMDSGLIELF